MKVTKRVIQKEIMKNTSLSSKTSFEFLEAFISIVKFESKTKIIKLSSFGTFFSIKTSKRLGRNPKTKESYIIHSRKKVIFRPSIKVKEVLN